MTTRPALFVGVATALVAGCLLAVPASSGSVSGGTRLGAVVLKASQVGPGYKLKTRPDSHCVQRCVTLDMCGFNFKSEAQRTQRLQVDYVKTRKEITLSNEVVRYRSGGTALAMHEIKRAVATCPRHAVTSKLGGPKLTYRIHRFTASHLLPGAIDLRMKISYRHNGHRVTAKAVVIYQVRGRILSGVYSFVPAGSTFAPTVDFAVHAAQASAANLRRG